MHKIVVPFLNLEPSTTAAKSGLVNAFTKVLDSNYFIMGSELSEFENHYSKKFGTNYTVGVSNGLDALVIALKTINVGFGDEVIVPSNTYIATVLAITQVGAIPVFVEPDPNTFNIDPARIAEKITKKTKAILPVHLFGQSCRMDLIAEIAAENNIFIVEDNAQSQGAKCLTKYTGTWGQINATSFYPGKNLGALGDAGAVTTDNEALAKQAKLLRNYGSEKKYYNEIIGHNMRLDELQAAFLNVKLEYLDAWTEERKKIAFYYLTELQGLADLKLPTIAENVTHVFHQFVILTKYRNSLLQYLEKNGIGVLIHYPVPPHLQKAYAHLNYNEGDFPIAEKLANECLSLPIWPGISKEQLKYVVDKIKEYFTLV